METLLDKLPTILVLAVLVGIFVALWQHFKSNRLQLWIGAWVLIFVHFVAQAFERTTGPTVFDVIDLGSLQLSAVLFIASLTSYFENWKRTLLLLFFACTPIFIYTVFYSFNKDFRLLYLACLLLFYPGNVAISLLWNRKLTVHRIFWLFLTLLVGTWSMYRAWHHDYDFDFQVTLTLSFLVTAYLFGKNYRRWSPGVIASAGGFVLWSAVFPLGAFLDAYYPGLHINPELFNTPKFFVAFGMILTVLEEKSAMLEDTNQRERKLNQQLQRFSSITSRLLTGVEVTRLCSEIALAITETSNFRRVGITLSADDRTFYLAGHSGLGQETACQLEQNAAGRKPSDIAELCRAGRKVGQNSYVLKPEQVAKYSPLRSQQEFPSNPHWENGYEMIVPLQSARGGFVGWISLDDPRDVNRVNAEEMSKIEMLAGDLAVTMDNGALHRQLVRSEKLAAIGQLVAGVAHELNNPLASVVGYSELLSDDIPAGPARQKLDKLQREAHRMRRIIENLLRFARQNSLEQKSADLQSLLQDVMTLREYHIRNHDIDVEVVLEPELPLVALDEDQFKQILLNLLNNSIDALDHGPLKRIRIEAERHAERIVVRFDDSGPGFAEVNRAFDPFYTTKPVGKGTGLGLSICYGIVKEHGGDIYALNLEPQGARIVLELPVFDPVTSSVTLNHLQRRTS